MDTRHSALGGIGGVDTKNILNLGTTASLIASHTLRQFHLGYLEIVTVNIDDKSLQLPCMDTLKFP